MASLAEIRAKLAAQENRQGGNSTGGGDNGIFPHWNIPENSQVASPNMRGNMSPFKSAHDVFFKTETSRGYLRVQFPFACTHFNVLTFYMILHLISY